jgi:hypothetical protein
VRAFEAIDIDDLETIQYRKVDRFLSDPPEFPESFPGAFPQRRLHVVIASQSQEFRPQAIPSFVVPTEVFLTLQMSEKAAGRALVDSRLAADLLEREGGVRILKQINDVKRLG